MSYLLAATRRKQGGGVPSIRTDCIGEQSKLLSVRHGVVWLSGVRMDLSGSGGFGEGGGVVLIDNIVSRALYMRPEGR